MASSIIKASCHKFWVSLMYRQQVLFNVTLPCRMISGKDKANALCWKQPLSDSLIVFYTIYSQKSIDPSPSHSLYDPKHADTSLKCYIQLFPVKSTLKGILKAVCFQSFGNSFRKVLLISSMTMHKAIFINKQFDKFVVEEFEWPEHNPDLNPIEHY